MSEQRSAIESWSELAHDPAARHSVAGYLPLILSAAGALGVLPFAVMRWMASDWMIAIIDTAIVAGFVSLGTFIYRTRKVRAASVAIAVLCLAGTLLTIYVRGPQQIYWAYPAMLASFYLLKPWESLILALALVAFVTPQLLALLPPFQVATIVISILVAMAFAFAFSSMNSRQQEKLMRLATRDPLTGAGNRHALHSKMKDVIGSFERHGLPSTLILLDIDHFKAVNDAHGHATGDEVLRRVTQIMSLRIRLTDSLYRIGGEEFLVLANGQNIEKASTLAEDLRTLIEANTLAPGLSVTVSVGVAELHSGELHNSWLKRADRALYSAKNAGRNTIRLAS